MSVVDFPGLVAEAAAVARRASRDGHAPGLTALPAAPAFPIEVLPPAVRAYVKDAAASLSVPAEMVAVPMLGFAGAVIGNRLHLELKNSYREFPTLYLAIIAPPGTGKTPALNLAQWPLDALQTEAEQDYRLQKALYEGELEAWKEEKDGEPPSEPRLRHYFSSNLTLETLVAMLDTAPGVAIIRDEILGWVSSMDQYRGGKGSDRQEYLSLWSAKNIKLDRKTTEPIYRRSPVACIVGGIQPDLVGELHHQAQKRDGFVERLLLIVPDVHPGPWTEETISPGRFADALAIYQALDALPAADLDSGAVAVGIRVKLSPQAHRSWVAWYNENQKLVAPATGLASGFYAKLPAHVARLALILHALWHPQDPRVMVSVECMHAAIELGECFRVHIHRFLALMQVTAPTQSAGLSPRIIRILQIAADDDLVGWVTRSDLLRRLGNVNTHDLTGALDDLLAAGKVERGEHATKTRPAEQWRLVPELANTNGSKDSNNSNNSALGSDADRDRGENVKWFESFESSNGHEQNVGTQDYEEEVI